MMNLLLSTIILIILVIILTYLYKAKKQGQKCVGCPYAKQCSKHHCHTHHN